jgi:predicted RND superfamily exporter protein
MRLRPLRSIPLRLPRLTLAVIAVMTVVLGYYARELRLDSAAENLLPANDPDRVYYDDVRKAFGSDEATFIALFSDNVFTPQTLAKIDALSKQLAAIEGVREVVSLTTVKGVEVGEMGLRVGRLMEELPGTPAEAAAFKKRVLAEPVYIGNLVSRDGTATGILVLFDIMSDAEFLRRHIEERINALVAAARGPEDFAVTGLQTLKILGAQRMRRDLVGYVPLSVLVVSIVLALSLRTVRGVLLPVAAILIGAAWTAGIMVLTGSPINIGTLVLPPLLVAIGIGYAVPLMSRYYQELQPGRPPATCVAAAVEEMRLPLAIAAFTTVLGFVALTFSDIRAVRDLGLYAVAGIVVMYFVTLGIIPAGLMVLPDPRHGVGRQYGIVSRLVERISNFAGRHRRIVLAVVAAACAASLWGATRIRVETDYLSFFNPRGAIRRDNARITQRLGGAQPIYVTIDADDARAIVRLDTLAAIRDLQDFIDQQPGVDSSLSLVDYVAVAQKALNPDARTRLPATQTDLSQILLFVTADDVRPVATADYMRGNIIVRSHLSGSAQVGTFVRRVEAYARSRFPRDVRVHVTGVIVLLNRSADALAHGHVGGLRQMFVVLLVLMSLLFLSVRAGLLSLVPIAVPIILLFGIMGWTGISLNISTCMIAVIAVGITIADTIHYLSTLNVELHRTGREEVALRNAARRVGPPMVFASVALAAGFATLSLSTFEPIHSFGLLTCVTVLLVLAADVMVTPALVMTTRLITLWDVLYVKLGPRPEREIPLFEGLRPFQARMVVLMSQLASAAPGTLMTQRGEQKSELYVLLSGRVDFRRREGERVIRQLGRGDVIGEMGLVRTRPRTGDTVVSAHTEYLILDAAAIERIRRRYPRIAATILLNLTRILSDRLETTTDELTASARGRPGAGSF